MSDEDLYKLAAQYTTDEALQAHIVERQLKPQLVVESLQEQGWPIEVGQVHVGAPSADDTITVTCTDCGRTGQLPLSAVPEGFNLDRLMAICPICMAKNPDA